MKYNCFLYLFLSLFSAELSAQLSATVSSTNPSCLANSGSAQVTASGGTGYTYKWSTGATTSSVTGLNAGTYTVTVFSSGGTLWDTVYLETFEGAHNWILNTSTGVNGLDNNFWVVNDNESGMNPGSCGTAGQNNKSLHVTSVFNPSGGAAYDAGGLCGILFCPETNMAATSPNINTSGTTNLVVRYDFIGDGSGLTDNASALISSNGGTSFSSLDVSLKSNNSGCSGQGRWTQRSYPLSPIYNNLTNMQIRLNWTNNDDGVGTDPSFAINNVLVRDSIPVPGDSIVKTVTLSAPSSPYFVTAALSIIQPGCGQNNGSINNVGIAGGTGPYQLTWKISGATIGNGNSLTNIGGGTYTLEVTDANSCFIDTSFTLSGGTSGGTVAISRADSVICSGDSSLFCAPSGFTTYLWNSGATTSCIQAKNAGNYRVTVTDNGGCSATSVNYALIVNSLPPVSISVNGNVLSSFNAVTYQWIFNGIPINGANDSVHVATQDGEYQVLVTDINGCAAISNATTVIISSLGNIADGKPLEVYPNPSKTKFSIMGLNFAAQESYAFEMVELSGRVLMSGLCRKGETEINAAELQPGVYFLLIDGTVKKLLKE